MNSKELGLIIAGVVVIVAIGLIVHFRGPGTIHTGGGTAGNGVPPPGALSSATSTTRAPVPADTVVPDEHAQNVPSNVALPHLVTAAAPAVPYSFRSFDISVEGGKFVPDTINVNEKDTVHLNITAKDGTYDFYQPDYGLFTALPKGQTKVVEFGATLTGKLTFYCKSCGGPDKGPVGYVVIVPLK